MDILRIPAPFPKKLPGKAQDLVDRISAAFRSLPDSRKPGNNRKFSMHDALCSAFSVFFTQQPSFLSFQRDLERTTGRNNVQSLFGLHQVPTDPRIRNLLKSVPAQEIAPLIKSVGDTLKAEGCLADYRVLSGTLLLVFDGTDTFSSETIHCPSCHETHRSDGSVLYRHIAVTPAIVAPGEPRVIPLPPEFVTPNDGAEKQDCELRAASRWLETWGPSCAPWGIAIPGDDLYAHRPFRRKVRERDFHFLFTCKPSSHSTLAEWVRDFERSGMLGTRTVRSARGTRRIVHETFSYRFLSDLPLRNSEDALRVNWLELTVTEDDTGKVVYKNSWITDHPVPVETVADLARAGRARWKIENEHIQTLKLGGYRLEHNFGHGKSLANLLASLNILAFLMHTAFEFLDDRYRTLRFRYGSRLSFFQKLSSLLEFFLFENWDHLIDVMFERLRVDTS